MDVLTTPKIAEMYGVTEAIARDVTDAVAPNCPRIGSNVRMIGEHVLPAIEKEMARRGYYRVAAEATAGNVT